MRDNFRPKTKTTLMLTRTGHRKVSTMSNINTTYYSIKDPKTTNVNNSSKLTNGLSIYKTNEEKQK